MGLTVGMYKLTQKYIFLQKDARKRVIKFIPYQISFTATLMLTVLIIKTINNWKSLKSIVSAVLAPFVIFFVAIFLSRFYMIWNANSYDKHFSFMMIFLSCLKFWDSTLLIKSYFGSTSQDELMKRVDDKREYLKTRQTEGKSTNNEMLAVVEEDMADDNATVDRKKDLKSLLRVEDLEEEKGQESPETDDEEDEGDKI